ncbi:MAG: hypothetical protein IPK53_11330 [bacterium]|nr:hypothetical protein [bacterium]
MSIINFLAESVIETTLQVSPERASLPTLISIENIIGQINEKGYELASSDEINKIAGLINNYYLPNPVESWNDQHISVDANPILFEDIQHFSEIQKIRGSMIAAAHNVARFEVQQDYTSSKQVQDKAVISLARSVQASRSWWDRNKSKVLLFVGRTVLGVLIDSLIGIPLGRIVNSVLDGLLIV